jgi:hypothetical protein
MAAITNKAEFLQYCIRRLGAPVINVEVDDTQLEDIYDDAVRKLQDFHMNGVERQYLRHQLTQTDIDNGYIPIPPSIIGVSRVFPLTGNGSSSSSYIFDLNYQIRLNDLWDLQSSSISYYVMVRQYTNMLDQLFNGQPIFRFNRVSDRVYIDLSKNKLHPDRYVCLEVLRALTPEEFPEMFMEPWFKKYATALIKKQWGANLKKYNGIVTIGNVNVNGQIIFDEAVQDIMQLEEELRNTFEEPVQFLMG